MPVGRGLNPLLAVNQVLAHAAGVRTIQRRLGFKFDILHGTSSAPILALREILGKWMHQQAATVHTIKSHSQYVGGSYRSARILNGVDRVIAQNNETKTKLIRHGCRPEKIQLIRSHIDTRKFRHLNDRAGLQQKLGLAGKQVVLYYGHLLPVKGVETWLDAFALAYQKNSNLYGVIGWSGLGDRAPYDQQISRLGLSGAVDIRRDGYDIVELVNAADLAVFPYPSLIATEANPSCILECLASQTPVITSRLPELTELFTDQQHLLFSEPKNPNDVAEKILQLLGDVQLQSNLRQAAYGILNQFSLERVGAQHLDLYQELLHAKH